jgi:hypothetical protein
VIAFLDQKALYCGGDGSVCLEVLHWFNFTVGRNQAAY